MLMKQQKTNAGDFMDLSSLTLDEASSPVEEVLPNIRNSKVGVTLDPSFSSSRYSGCRFDRCLFAS